MERRLVAVGLAVVVAGCGAFGGVLGGPNATTGTDGAGTLTPVPVPEVTETPVTLPPGMTGASVTDADALVDAHLASVEGRSYTLQVQVQTGGAVTRHRYRVETPTRYSLVDRLVGSPPPRVGVEFADGETAYTRNDYGGNVELGRSDDPALSTPRTVVRSRALLDVDRVAVAETRVDGEPAYELTGEYPVHPADDSLRNVTLRAVVEPDGFIRSLNVSYVVVEDDLRTSVTRWFAYTDVGETTVERPAWVDREFTDTVPDG